MSDHKNSLERYIGQLLKKIDKYARPTKASGASTELGDILNNYFLVECKQQRTTENPKINKSTWKKLLSEIPMGSLKIPFLALENKGNDIFIALDHKDFFSLVYKLHELGGLEWVRKR